MAAGAMVEWAAEAQVRERRGLAAPVLLAVGWIGLFAYCASYLTEDMPFRRSSAQMVGEPLFDQPEDLPRHVITVAAPEPPAVTAPAAMTPSAPQAFRAQPPAPPARVRAAAYVGVGGPTT